jgi:trans-aconitate 2-methyltransferase
MSRDIWDPSTYSRYADERARPFFELTARIRADQPDYVVDAGCGTGETTAELIRRWPNATVEGFDSSPAMIATARENVPEGRFTVAAVTLWRPDRPVDVLVSNAVLHWVPTHRDLLAHWVGLLPPGGWLAFQVPGNFAAPSHLLIRELCRSERWRERLGDLDRPSPVDGPSAYLELMSGLGCRVDAWETTYAQVLQGEDAVLTWLTGTTLRPVLDRLTPQEQQEYRAQLRDLLAEAYPAGEHGTVFPFRRVFVVAQTS